jgi:hypothetical protein
VAFLSLIAGARILYWRLFFGGDLPGYASLATGVFFIGGLQLITIGILGEYVGRIHNEVKRRPAYVIREAIGCAPAATDATLTAEPHELTGRAAS